RGAGNLSIRAVTMQTSEVMVKAGGVTLAGNLSVPTQTTGLVIFAHGSGSSRFSSRNRYVAEQLQARRLATLLFDLLTADEHRIDQHTRELRFDIGLLSSRLRDTVDWALQQPACHGLAIGLFGASTGAAAALVAAAERPAAVRAVVSRGGRPDLAGTALPLVRAPTLLIVGGDDGLVIDLNRQAAQAMQCEIELEIVPGASHLFEEPGTLEEAARLAADWFQQHLRR